MKLEEKLYIGLGILVLLVMLFLLAWGWDNEKAEHVKAKRREQVAQRLTIVHGKEWGDVRTELVTVTRTQDFLVMPDYGRPFLCRVVELSDGRTLLHCLGQFYPLNADTTLLHRTDQGAHVGDQWQSSFGKRVNTYDYTIDGEEVFIDTHPYVEEDMRPK